MSATASMSILSRNPPVGLAGEFKITSFVFGDSLAARALGREREAPLLQDRQRDTSSAPTTRVIDS